MKMLYKEETPTTGTVLIGGINIANLPSDKVPNLRRCMGIVFQDYKLLQNQTVFDNIAYVIRTLGISSSEIRNRVTGALKVVGLLDKIHAKPSELSGGEQQRVSIARALVNGPPLLIADEPTPGLDAKSVEETIHDIRKLKDQGKGVLLITHEIDVALKTADRIAIFYSGYVIEINKVENFLNSENLLHPYTKALVDALPKNGFKLTEGVQPLEEVPGCPYYENCPIRSDKCNQSKPELIEHDGAMIRCFNFDKVIPEEPVSEEVVEGELNDEGANDGA
jgi:oligopeptide/dipeptide ABC transporter ATP-binding protein